MSGKAVGGNHAGIAVAEALGLNPKQVSSIVLHYDCDSIVTADVTLIVHDNQHQRFVSVLREYELIERVKLSEEGAA